MNRSRFLGSEGVAGVFLEKSLQRIGEYASALRQGLEIVPHARLKRVAARGNRALFDPPLALEFSVGRK